MEFYYILRLEFHQWTHSFSLAAPSFSHPSLCFNLSPVYPLPHYHLTNTYHIGNRNLPFLFSHLNYTFVASSLTSVLLSLSLHPSIYLHLSPSLSLSHTLSLSLTFIDTLTPPIIDILWSLTHFHTHPSTFCSPPSSFRFSSPIMLAILIDSLSLSPPFSPLQLLAPNYHNSETLVKV